MESWLWSVLHVVSATVFRVTPFGNLAFRMFAEPCTHSIEPRLEVIPISSPLQTLFLRGYLSFTRDPSVAHFMNFAGSLICY